MVRACHGKRCPGREADRCRRRRLPHVLRRGQDSPAACDGADQPPRSTLPIRLRGDQGDESMIARVLAIAKRSWVRVLVQALVSLGLIGVLVVAVQSTNLLASFRAIQPSAIALAAGLQILAFVLNSLRWQLLLANGGIAERLPR